MTGYAVKLDQSPTTAAGTAVTQTGTAVSWSGRTDGTWWVHAAARDKAGLWSPTRHLSFGVDTTAPGAPGNPVSSTHPVTSSAYANRTASFSWAAPSDLSGAAGYAVIVDRVADTLPVTTGAVQTATNLTTTVNADGTWYLHVRAKDRAGNWSSTAAHLPFKVDMTLPPSPVVSSSTHPDQTGAYKSGSFSATWTAPSGASAGYSIVVDSTADTVPDSTAETTGASYATTRTEGTWYLHVRGIDSNGTGGATSHYRFTVDTSAPGAPAVTSVSCPQDAWAGGAQVTGTFTLTPDGTDTRSLTYKIDGGTAQTVTSTGGSVEVPIAPATEGSHQLTVTATDRAGNVSAETKRAFHVGKATVTAPANGEVLVGSVDLAVSAPTSLTGVTFLQRASAADPWQVIPVNQVTHADGSAVTWPAPLTSGSAPKLLWDTSSLAGRSGLQIGARFDGAYAPPEADPVSAVVDRVEVIDGGGPGDGIQQSEPAQAYALEQAAARAAEAPDAFAPPYIDPATGELVAPVIEPASADEATAPIQVTQAPADEGSGLPAEDTEEGTKPDDTSTETETPAPPAEGAVETTGVESFEMPEDTTEPTPVPDGPTVTEQVEPRTEVVEHSVTTLESVRDGSVKLPGQNYYSGDLALYQVKSGSVASPRIYKGGKASNSSRYVHDYWRRWAQNGDKVCTGGMMTGEVCGWKVVATQAAKRYTGGTTAKNMVIARKSSGSCTVKGDSGGPVYTVDGSGRAYAKGIVSGGGGGGSDNSGGLFDQCELIFTDIGLANSALPGTVAWY